MDGLLADNDYEKIAEGGREYAIREHNPETFLKKVMTEYGRAEDFIR